MCEIRATPAESVSQELKELLYKTPRRGRNSRNMSVAYPSAGRTAMDAAQTRQGAGDGTDNSAGVKAVAGNTGRRTCDLNALPRILTPEYRSRRGPKDVPRGGDAPFFGGLTG